MAILSICIGICGMNLCIAQSNTTSAATNVTRLGGVRMWHGDPPQAPPGATNWGKAVHDVRLSVTITNNVVEIGSTNLVAVVITNSSEIGIILPSSLLDFDVILTNTEGKLFHLIAPLSPPLFSRIIDARTINAGEYWVWLLSVPFEKNILPGEYTLQAFRGFTSADGSFQLESNILKVQIN